MNNQARAILPIGAPELVFNKALHKIQLKLRVAQVM
jgi:hypothetical protein